MPRTYTKTPPEVRMARRTTRTPDGCLIFDGTPNNSGYGLFYDGNKERLAHRWAYEHHYGPIPAGLVINHLCRQKMCVNPEHLEAVTQRDNTRYSDEALGIRSGATHCPHGHEYTPDNLVKGKHRKCKTCHRERAAAQRKERSHL